MPELSAVPETLFLLVLGVLVVFASWSDISRRKIPNWVTIVTLVLGLAHVWFANGLHDAAMALAHTLVALIATMVLFALRVVGGGDAKFYAGLAAWLPLEQGLLLLVSVALAGLVLLAFFLATRLRGRARRTRAEPSDFDKLPYGVAIGLGGFAAVLFA